MNYKEIFDERGALYNQAHELAPDAREHERQAMLRWLKPKAGETIVVAAAGGGFDAVAIESAVHPHPLELVCIEPSPVFSEFIPRHMQTHNCGLDSLPIPENSVDAVLNLAALHHISDREAVFAEWMRILKPGGRLVIADVMVNSGNSGFLNEIVSRYTPGGHDGDFLEMGYLQNMVKDYSLEDVEEQLETYTWDFKCCEEMVQFSKLIFGMVEADDEQVLEGVEEYLNPRKAVNGGIAYEWSLLFYRAFKPL